MPATVGSPGPRTARERSDDARRRHPGDGVRALSRRLARVHERRRLLAAPAARAASVVARVARRPARRTWAAVVARAAAAPGRDARPDARAGRLGARRDRANARRLRPGPRQPARAHRATPHARPARAVARADEGETPWRTPRARIDAGARDDGRSAARAEALRSRSAKSCSPRPRGGRRKAVAEVFSRPPRIGGIPHRAVAPCAT